MDDVAALSQAGCVAVLLPVAYYSLAAQSKPPITALRASGASMAVASDRNPGSAPVVSLLIVASMAKRLFGLTTAEVLAGITLQAARALGLHAECGSLAVGHAADVVVWDIDPLDEFDYWCGYNRRRAVEVVFGRLSQGI